MKASKVLKRLHRKALIGNRFVSLKQLARELMVEGDEDEKLAVDSWRLNKSPAQRNLDKEDRWKRKGGIITLQRSATRTARSKRGTASKGGASKDGK